MSHGAALWITWALILGSVMVSSDIAHVARALDRIADRCSK